jgi:hypothetical protein
MRRILIKSVVGLVSIVLIAMPGWAQMTNPYQLTGSLSAGGGTVSGGSYQVGVALGQAGAGETSGGGYTLGGGIFGGGQTAQPQPPQRSVYLPVVQR